MILPPLSFFLLQTYLCAPPPPPRFQTYLHDFNPLPLLFLFFKHTFIITTTLSFFKPTFMILNTNSLPVAPGGKVAERMVSMYLHSCTPGTNSQQAGHCLSDLRIQNPCGQSVPACHDCQLIGVDSAQTPETFYAHVNCQQVALQKVKEVDTLHFARAGYLPVILMPIIYQS